MSPDDLRKARRGLDLTQSDMAKALGLDPWTVRNYEKGNRGIPKAVAVAVLYMATYGLLEGVMDTVPEWRLPA